MTITIPDVFIFRAEVLKKKACEAESNRSLPSLALSVALLIGSMLGLVFLAADGVWASEPKPRQQVEAMTKIRIVMESAEVTAVLVDNATTRDFISLLPMTLTLTDYHNTEKIADLPKRLSIKGAPEGIDPSVGDITYYAPWGNLALFYRDFGYSRGLVRLGRIETGVKGLEQPGPLKATIELAN